MLNLKEGQWPRWDIYTQVLTIVHIQILDCDDELIWDKDQARTYMPKLGYL